jgi:DNA gyrase subunit B
MYPAKPIKLEDCREHGIGSNAELFIVEGDSAAATVAALRSQANQAVLPMQGKPMNAIKASADKVTGFALYKEFSKAIGWPLLEQGNTDPDLMRKLNLFDPAQLQFAKVALLFDPDADGIHCGALMLGFIYRWMRPLLEQQRVVQIHPPLYRIEFADSHGQLHERYSYFQPQHIAMMKQLQEQGAQNVKPHYFRGLGSMDQAMLRQRCIDRQTRVATTVTVAAAQTAMVAFQGV